MSISIPSRATIVMLCTGVALVAGCAAPRAPTPKYVPPTTGAVAKLAVRGNGSDLYGALLYADSETCGQPQYVTGARRHDEPPQAVNIAAGAWTTVDFVAVDEVRKTRCRTRWSFQPVADRTYVLSGVATTTYCSARVYDATNPDDMKLEASAVQRNTEGNTCLSIAAAQERKKRMNANTSNAATTRDEPMLAPSATADDLKGLMGK